MTHRFALPHRDYRVDAATGVVAQPRERYAWPEHCCVCRAPTSGRVSLRAVRRGLGVALLAGFSPWRAALAGLPPLAAATLLPVLAARGADSRGRRRAAQLLEDVAWVPCCASCRARRGRRLATGWAVGCGLALAALWSYAQTPVVPYALLATALLLAAPLVGAAAARCRSRWPELLRVGPEVAVRFRCPEFAGAIQASLDARR